MCEDYQQTPDTGIWEAAAEGRRTTEALGERGRSRGVEESWRAQGGVRIGRFRRKFNGLQSWREQVPADRVRSLPPSNRLSQAHPHARGVRQRGLETMSTTTANLDLKRYGRLLAQAVPIVVTTEKENERLLAIVESLMAKGEKSLTPEEDALLELLTNLIHDFESNAYPIPKSEPHEMVAFLLEQREIKPSDLWPGIGSKSRVSEILAGKRSISKDQAKRL